MRPSFRYPVRALVVAMCVFAAIACSKSSKSTCANSSECETGQTCTGGRCVGQSGTCQTNANCAAHEFCNVQKCEARVCVDNVQCPTNLCVNGLCQPGQVQDTSGGSDQTTSNDATSDLSSEDATPADVVGTEDSTAVDGTGVDTQLADQLGVDSGTPCSKHSDCPEKQVCDPTKKVCRAGCRTHGDCDVDQICNETTLTCSGSGSACTRDADCAGNEFSVCLPFKPDGKTALEYRCQPPVGTKNAGESCLGDGECRSGSCLDGGNGKVCFGVCKDDNDCHNGTKCYPGMVTYTFDMGTETAVDDVYDSAPACVPPMGSYKECLGATDCQQLGEICLPIANATRTAFEFRCFTATGKKFGPGVDCTDNGDCASNQCIPPGSGMTPTPENPGICFGICDPAKDECFAQTQCLSVSLTVNDRGTTTTSDDVKGGATICKYPSR